MQTSKLLVGGSLAAILCSLACSCRVEARPAAKADDELPTLLKSKPLQPGPEDDDLQKLLKARYNQSLAITLTYFRDMRAGKASPQAMVDRARRVLHAGKELYARPQERMQFLKQMLEMADKIENLSASWQELDRGMFREFKLELQIESVKSKRAAEQPEKK